MRERERNTKGTKRTQKAQISFLSLFCALCVLLVPFVFRSRSLAQQSQNQFPLKRFEVIRVNPADIDRLPPSLRPIFVDPVPDAEPVDSLDEAAKRAGFGPRLPKSAAMPQLGVIDPVRQQAQINVGDLTAALRDAKAGNVAVPPAWDGVVIGVEQMPGVLADYGKFFIAQAPPLTLNAPAGFPLDQLLETLFRVVGMNAAEARNLRQKFAANPAAFFPIPTRYEMDIREIRLTSGSGLLLQNGDRIGELALMWSSGDRSYFLSGLIPEDQAIAIANSIP